MARKTIIGWGVIMLMALGSSAQNKDAILGRWMDDEQKTIIEIYREKDVFSGRIVWLKDSLDAYGNEVRDVLNPNVKLRPRKVVGSIILTGFEWDGTDVWKKGRIYYYHNGNEYNGKISVDEEGDLRLKGYYSILFFLGRTHTWTRVQPHALTGRR
jgi:uncharacterized protein (DUF2147 family)